VSRQDKLKPPQIDDGLPETPADDDRLQVDLRLGLDEIAAAEEERLRATARRRPSRRELADLALKLYDARRGRDRMFSDELFGEPAWDMLLALYGLPNRGIVLGVTSLGHAANVPPTTGLRWQKLLLDQGLIERGPDVRDSRQQLVRLTSKGRLMMERYLVRLFYCDGRPAGKHEQAG
jgi:DNA-binding MarR family transcriptional regulator